MNILFLGGAKRVSMARMIKAAAKRRGEEANLYSWELSSHLPIAAVASILPGKRWSDPDVYEALYDVVRKHSIDIIIPFVDGAVRVAAEMMRRYPELVFAPTGSPELAESMFDKVEAARIFEHNGLPIPETLIVEDKNEVDRKLIAKPRRGSASKGLINIDSTTDLQRILPNINDYLVQQRFDHREEYTVDCYVSVRSGKIITIVPRKRIEVVGGEVTHTETVFCPEVYDLAKQALETLGIRGAVTIQVLHDLDTDCYMIMEINPRLGGGATCAVYAGADIPAMILADYHKEDMEFVCYRPNTEIVRYQLEVPFYN